MVYETDTDVMKSYLERQIQRFQRTAPLLQPRPRARFENPLDRRFRPVQEMENSIDALLHGDSQQKNPIDRSEAIPSENSVLSQKDEFSIRPMVRTETQMIKQASGTPFKEKVVKQENSGQLPSKHKDHGMPEITSRKIDHPEKETRPMPRLGMPAISSDRTSPEIHIENIVHQEIHQHDPSLKSVPSQNSFLVLNVITENKAPDDSTTGKERAVAPITSLGNIDRTSSRVSIGPESQPPFSGHGLSVPMPDYAKTQEKDARPIPDMNISVEIGTVVVDTPSPPVRIRPEHRKPRQSLSSYLNRRSGGHG